ncbi:FecR family protein [Chitinophaga sp. 22536]|uniref:DUF4974 domain-containing protein n=1 Tax=Chitinophaga eiseniae TaxID=634771 RepID=A0A847SKI8_9BACT|nr:MULTISPECIES: FecR family protein [Chitinophaga]MBC9914486.1 FecR domain-containing protein [Chitinophaga varians]NLR78058.1 DUF4974 domain-containing protein [Chitinophaga eiseniae]
MSAFNNQEHDHNRRYSELARKWLKGTLTPEEEREYNDWYDSVSDDKEIKMEPDFAASRQQLKRRIFVKISRIADLHRPALSIQKRKKLYFAAASVVLLFIAISFYRYSSSKDSMQDPETLTESPYFKNDIAPGVNKAILTLSNGRKITLDDSTSGMLADEGGARIVKSGKDGVTYEEGKGAVTVVNNTVTTPRGSQYRLTLPDGTKVWLNASSSITFPTLFQTRERAVKVSGEAYFEVAKNAAQPFIVSVGNMQVSVLGTHFNVNAYADENTIRTTLLEGSVKIIETFTQHGRIIVPGEQSRLDKMGNISVEKVNTEEIIAWKDGFFRFHRTDIATLMRQISRWYNVDVQYEGAPAKDLFTGTVPRTLPLSELLMVLQHANIRFKIEGNKLTVLSL